VIVTPVMLGGQCSRIPQITGQSMAVVAVHRFSAIKLYKTCPYIYNYLRNLLENSTDCKINELVAQVSCFLTYFFNYFLE